MFLGPQKAMTPSQKAVYLAIDVFWKRFGFGPSIDNIMHLTGNKGRGNVSKICRDLIKMKICHGIPGKARSIRPKHIRLRELE